MSLNTFPSLPIDTKSTADIDDGRDVKVRSDGIGDVRKLHADVVNFSLAFVCDPTQLATFIAFYNANNTAAFYFAWLGTTYTVTWGAPAYRPSWISPIRTAIACNLVAQ